MNTKSRRVAEHEQAHFWRRTSQTFDYLRPRPETRTETRTGYITRYFEGRGFGFINADGIEERVFFHRQQLVAGVIPSVRSRVRFQLGENDQGYTAANIENEDESEVDIT